MSEQISRVSAKEAQPVLSKEAEIKQLLCGSTLGWYAGPQVYDFLHRVQFFDDGTGMMMSGGGQHLSLAVGFLYVLTSDATMRFEYGDTTNRTWGIKYKRNRRNPFKKIEFEIADGPFQIQGLYTATSYDRVLRFKSSPFPGNSSNYYGENLFFRGDPNADPKLLSFYGYLTGETSLPSLSQNQDKESK